MKRSKIIYALLAIALCCASCSDVVNYNDGYDDQLTSYGPPSITKISKAGDLESAITEGALTDMIVLQGDNLAGVQSIKINDVEVDLSTVYAVRTQITLPIPRMVPDNVNNLVTVVTEKGTTTFPLTVTIPDLKVEGFYNEFAQAGDTVQIMGKYLDLYELSVENGVFSVGGTSITPLRTSADTIVFIMPTGTPDGSVFSMSSPKVATPITAKFREAGTSILDIESMSGGYVTDGKASGDPKPLIGKFFRIKGQLSAWSWNSIFWSGFNLPDIDVKNNPQNYYVKFEINTKSSASISSGNIIIGGNRQDNRWNPGADGALNTYGKWRTIRLELTDLFHDNTNGTYLVEGNNDFTSTYQPDAEVNADFSICNYRIVKK